MQSSGAVDAPDSYRAILTDLYTRYNPEKLAKIDYILDKFVGKEEEVIAAVREKYGDNGDSSGPSIRANLPTAQTAPPRPSCPQSGRPLSMTR